MTFDERQQFLLLDEEFADDTMIADLNATIDFGGVALTSISTYIDRDILVSRDASAKSWMYTLCRGCSLSYANDSAECPIWYTPAG